MDSSKAVAKANLPSDGTTKGETETMKMFPSSSSSSSSSFSPSSTATVDSSDNSNRSIPGGSVGENTGNKINLPVFKREGGMTQASFLSNLLPSLAEDPFLGYFQHDVPFLFPTQMLSGVFSGSGGSGGSSSGETRSISLSSPPVIAIQENHRLKTEIISTPTEYIVRCDIPGVTKEHCGVEIGDYDINIIIHRPKHKEEEKIAKEEGENYIRTERARGSVQRKIKFPANVNLPQSIVNVCCGLLEIRIPKLPQTEIVNLPAGHKIIPIV